MHLTIEQQFAPRRFPGMSAKMAAIVEYLAFDEAAPRSVSPAIREMVMTSDQMVLARQENDVGLNQFIGSAGELSENLVHLFEAIEDTDGKFSDDRKNELSRLFNARLPGLDLPFLATSRTPAP